MIRDLFKRKTADVHLTKGRTMDNAQHLSPRVLDALTERYAGTRLGRQVDCYSLSQLTSIQTK